MVLIPGDSSHHALDALIPDGNLKHSTEQSR